MKIKKILISGGSGFIGTALRIFLESRGFDVAILTRRKNIEEVRTFAWDYEKNYIDNDAIEFADIVIHLAGENIGSGRWTCERKQQIIDSRVKTTKLLFDSIKLSKLKPKQFISASAVGIYGFERVNEPSGENSPIGRDFLSKLVFQWETEITKIRGLGVRTNILRLGIVLSDKGGALPKMLKPARFGLASALGNGQQTMPWISLEDLLNMFLFLIQNENLNTVFNAVSPHAVNNRYFMKAMAKSKKLPFFMPAVPAFVLKLMFGEMSQIILEGKEISSEKIIRAGFKFKHLNLNKFFDEKQSR